MHMDFLFAAYDVALSFLTEGASCETQDGNTCIFPFLTVNSDGLHLVEGCTTVDDDPKPWCSYKVDADSYHTMGYYSYCSDSCPMDLGILNI